jgi:hypothetical protein
MVGHHITATAGPERPTRSTGRKSEISARPCRKRPAGSRPDHDRLRDNPLHLLRDNSDIGYFAAIINEAIEAKAVVKMAEQDDLVLKPKIGSPSAATTTTSKAASAAVKTASASVVASPKAATAAVEAAAATVYATAMVHATAVDAAAVDAAAIDAAAIYSAAVPDRGVSRDVGPATSIGTSVKA